MPSTSFPIMLYLLSTLDRLLVANAMGQKIVSSSALPVSHSYFILPVIGQLQGQLLMHLYHTIEDYLYVELPIHIFLYQYPCSFV